MYFWNINALININGGYVEENMYKTNLLCLLLKICYTYSTNKLQIKQKLIKWSLELRYNQVLLYLRLIFLYTVCLIIKFVWHIYIS